MTSNRILSTIKGVPIKMGKHSVSAKSKATMKAFSFLICILGIKAASSAILPNEVLLEEWEVGVNL